MGLTLFAIPKPFKGHIDVIQRNAIQSWARLPEVQLVLLGGEFGTADVAKEFGALHVPQVERNSYGTPYVSSCFEIAERVSTYQMMSYVNADILLLPDFARAVERVARVHGPLLMVGERTDLAIDAPIEFAPGWDSALRARAALQGERQGHYAIDYFVFRRGLWDEIPPFAIGRWTWDNWLLYGAVRSGAMLIDATPSVLAIHQNHEYEHAEVTGPDLRDGPEARANRALSPDWRTWYTLGYASQVLYPRVRLPAWSAERLRHRLRRWLHFHPRLLALHGALRRPGPTRST